MNQGKIDYETKIKPGQKFAIDFFRPEDAAGIANLFFIEYGAGYPFDMYYIPEQIIAENKNGNINSVVARTPEGDIIGHGALYRSSPVHRNLYEIGQYIIHPEYRTTFAAYKINVFIAERLVEVVRPDGIFGEAVCHITATQKSSSLIGMKDAALEIDLMPATAYEKANNAAGRVTCLIQFRLFNDNEQEVFIPHCYRQQIEFILSDMDIRRKINISKKDIPAHAVSEAQSRYFPHAGVGRFNVISAGHDFADIIARGEDEGRKNGIQVWQYFLNLEMPWIGRAVDILRERGYFLGGYLPRWFDRDGLIMQKITTIPDFQGIRLYSDKARAILESVRLDWERTR
jgi:hypothetical protein